MARRKPKLVEPAHLWVPEHASSAGAEAIGLAESAGLKLDPEQELAVDAILAERPDGRWAAFEAAVIAARQNLKTFLFKVIALSKIYLFGDDLVVWTAHEFNTAMEGFRDVKEIIDGADHLRRRVKKIIEANGDEGIEFLSGQRLRFKARTKTGGRGLTGDTVLLDEGFALQPSHMGSLMPTMSAKSLDGNPQLIYGSSAGLIGSGVLRRVRDRGRKGGDPSLAYLEWCAPEDSCARDDCDHRAGTKGCAADDVEKIRLANPALGRRISLDWILGERRSMPPEEFVRERLGWWDKPVDDDDSELLLAWAECAKPKAKLEDPIVLAADVAPQHAAASIAACGANGTIEIVEHRRGSSWLVQRLVELGAHRPGALGLDPSGPIGSMITDFEKAGFAVRSAQKPDAPLVVLEGRELVRACGAIYGATLEHELVHRDQPILNDAVAGAYRRPVGDAWKWSRRDSTVDISPLVAATVARFVWGQPTVSKRPAVGGQVDGELYER